MTEPGLPDLQCPTFVQVNSSRLPRGPSIQPGRESGPWRTLAGPRASCCAPRPRLVLFVRPMLVPPLQFYMRVTPSFSLICMSMHFVFVNGGVSQGGTYTITNKDDAANNIPQDCTTIRGSVQVVCQSGEWPSYHHLRGVSNTCTSRHLFWFCMTPSPPPRSRCCPFLHLSFLLPHICV